MDQKTQQQIEAYLADEEKLFGDWYRSLGQPDYDPDMIPCGTSPETGNNKKMFNEWVKRNWNVLKEAIMIQFWFFVEYFLHMCYIPSEF